MKKITFVLLGVLLALAIKAQPSAGGYPLGLGGKLMGKAPIVELPQVSNAELLEQDRLNALSGEKSLRFGLDFPVDYTLENSGNWQTAANGRLVWRLEVRSTSARNLNFVFDQFWLPAGARFFAYSADGTHILGAFTEANNNRLHNFATLPVKGNRVVLELSVPEALRPALEFRLSSIVHGYRDFYKELKDFEDSGECNNNVVCPEGEPWQEQIRSSVMLLSGNFRFCSGAAINNTSNDGTPYILTADHCEPSTTDIFMFNYFSPVCTPNQDGSTSDVMQGCIIRARNPGSDFALVELLEPFEPAYNVFLSGWSRQNEPPDSTTGIHHPRGDVMKISFNIDGNGVENWGGADCWHVFDWEDGTTEPGSSGSPLYNEQKQIIGQLYGGTANCDNNIDDYYGRLVASWDGEDADLRLRDWLDPTNTDVASLDGVESGVPQVSVDARLSSIDVPLESYCSQSTIIPIVKVRNSGAETLFSFTLVYGFGTDLQDLFWNGVLASNAQITLTLPEIDLPLGQNLSFTANILNPNNTNDQVPANNALQRNVDSREGRLYRLNLNTDFYPEETGFRIENVENDSILFETPTGAVPEGQNVYRFCMPNGCYRFVITDEAGDGICCGFSGNGSFTLQNNLNQPIGSGGQFQDTDTVLFCVGNVGIEQLWSESAAIRVFPNPANEHLNLQLQSDLLGHVSRFTVFDITGKAVMTERIQASVQSIDLGQFSSGLYLLRVDSDLGPKTIRFVKQ